MTTCMENGCSPGCLLVMSLMVLYFVLSLMSWMRSESELSHPAYSCISKGNIYFTHVNENIYYFVYIDFYRLTTTRK